MAAITGTLRRAPRWAAVLVVGLIGGMMLVQPGSAAPPSPVPAPDMPVAEQNLDSSGYIAIHEQGTADVNVTGGNMTVGGTVAATQSGAWEVDANQKGSWSVDVDNFPSVQPVSGTVNVGNFPTTQNVNVTNSSIPVTGTVQISSSSSSPVYVEQTAGPTPGYGGTYIDARDGYSSSLTIPSGTVLTDFVVVIDKIDSHGAVNCDILVYDGSSFLFSQTPGGVGVYELHLESGIPSDGTHWVGVANTHGNVCHGEFFWTGHS